MAKKVLYDFEKVEDQVIKLFQEGLTMKDVCKKIDWTPSTLRNRIAKEYKTLDKFKELYQIKTKKEAEMEELMDKILYLFSQGHRTKEVVKIIGISHERVERLVHRAGYMSTIEARRDLYDDLQILRLKRYFKYRQKKYEPVEALEKCGVDIHFIKRKMAERETYDTFIAKTIKKEFAQEEYQ